MTKQTKWHVRPARIQISLSIHPVWSEFSLSAWRKLGSLATHWTQSEDFDQTERMPRLIWVFAGRTCHLLVLSWGGSSMDVHYLLIVLHLRIKYHTFSLDTFQVITGNKFYGRPNTGLQDLYVYLNFQSTILVMTSLNIKIMLWHHWLSKSETS